MATPKEIAEIADAIKSIPGKKERLRESLRVLKSFSSSATFTLEWDDIDDRLSAIEKSIHEQYDVLMAKLLPLGKSRSNSSNNSNHNDKSPEEDVNPRPELKSLCVSMDAEGLIIFMAITKSEDLNSLIKELAPALRFAPDPAHLVLNAVEDFYLYSKRGRNPPHLVLNAVEDFYAHSCPSKRGRFVRLMVRRSCINLLENLQLISPEIGPSVREKALVLAAEWKAEICFGKGEDNNLGIIAFLQLIASYNLVANYDHDYILELFTNILCQKNALVLVKNLVKNLGLSDNLPELIQKLSSSRKQLDAVRIVYACDVVEKFPPVPLLQDYVNDSERMAQEMVRKGNYSKQSQHDAAAKLSSGLQLVHNAIKEYKLENMHPCMDLKKRLSQLGEQLASISYSKIQNKQASNWDCHRKATATPAIAMPGNTDCNDAGRSLSGAAIGHSETRKSPIPYLDSSDPFAGTRGMYDRSSTYSGYPPGRTLSYGSSLYP